ncbi:MAG: aminotransferase class III-fold pyridoxal phosphate-dependent enzyme [Myxococcales bacterium FL481]|nr:MAG: aminotransferase class III-fold pyridoxal phosphate-dependent enzyme [Myxococcales bacterium FL481]
MSVVNLAPAFDPVAAQALARELFAIDGPAKPLPSERDQNFHIDAGERGRFVLKIANASESPAFLELQNAMLAHLATASLPITTPRVIPSVSGDTLPRVDGRDGRTHLVRLLEFIPGRCLAEAKPHDRNLLRSLGAGVGAMDRALASFDHPAARREFIWDLRQAPLVRDNIDAIDGPQRKAWVTEILDNFSSTLAAQLDGLSQSVIHNDWNDYNVLVSEPGDGPRRVTGVIDFGDTVYSTTVGDLAITLAYVMLDKPDPISVACEVVAGYHAQRRLTEAELEVLFPLVQTRLAQSVCISARQKLEAPDNEYLTISEAPAWALLEKLAPMARTLPLYRFRAACGLPACPQHEAIVTWLRSTAAQRHPLMGRTLDSAHLKVLDLSVGQPETAAKMRASETGAPSLVDELRRDGVAFGIGRYAEPRTLYAGPGFEVPGLERPQQRTVHLGLDVFAPADTPIYAPLDGTIHSLRDNDAPLDYGPTIIVAHECPAGRFYTLYGHLSRESLTRWKVGQPVRGGEELARMGQPAVNGGWQPHVHLQLVLDLLHFQGDFPGAAVADEQETWLSLSPDPNVLLDIPDTAWPEAPLSAADIERRRHDHLGSALSLSYQSHLHIVRGYRQYLYDAQGRRYLDGVNNVPHVGHCHDKVVAAARAQIGVLNTNTRYLHPHLIELAERLAATMPDPLSVCYFVCSGSEANELALRMAWAHTRSRELLILDHAYHGNTGNLVDMSPYKFKRRGGHTPPPHIHVLPVPDAYRGQFRGEPSEVLEPYAAAVDESLAALNRDGKRPGALFCESLPGCAGQVELVPGYLARAYASVRAAGGVCVADEVQVGFGRVGSHFWGFQTQEVVPDIVTMGKPMGNGHPVAAVVTTPEIAASFANGMEYFNTFGGNTVSCAIALAVLDVIAEENLQANARDTGGHLRDRLSALAQTHPIIGNVRGRGLFLGAELVLDRERRTPATQVARYVVERMKNRGILLSTDGPDDNVLKMKPPLVFQRENADQLVDCLAEILEEDVPRAAERNL